MQAQELINSVREELVETIGAFWSDSQLLALLNRGEKDFVNKTRILEGRATMQTTIGSLNYPLPSNWLSAKGVTYDDIDVPSGRHNLRRLRPTNLEKMLQERPQFRDTSDTTTYGLPSQYFVWGREIWLDRAPDKVTSVELWFKSKPIPLTVATQEINVDDSLSDALHYFMLWKAWSKEKELDLAQAAEAEYLRFVGEGRRFVKKQSGDQAYMMDIESGMPITGNANTFPIR
jgi:hypothetical protein